MSVKTYKFLKQLRLAGIVSIWMGVIFHSALVFGLGLLLWFGTYIYSFEKLEVMLIHEEKEEDTSESE